MLLFCEYAVANPNLKKMTPLLVWLLKVNNKNVICWRIDLTELQWGEEKKKETEEDNTRGKWKLKLLIWVKPQEILAYLMHAELFKLPPGVPYFLQSSFICKIASIH